MKVLVTGACGLLGAHLTAALGAGGYDVVGLDRHPWWGDQPANVHICDLTMPGLITDMVESVRPDVLVHCAAMVNVDACEQNPALAYSYNADLTRRIARAAPAHCLVVYLSTDGIFGGNRAFATEEHLPLPRTVYGRSKLQGEWEVQLATDNHLIVRTNFYGWSSGRKQTSAEWLYDALKRGEPITLFDDFFFTPIYVVDFVERLQGLIERRHCGIVHLGGRDRVSKAAFGALMAEAAGLSMQHVRRGSINDAPLLASRPKDMSLDSGRFVSLTGLALPDCAASLSAFLRDRERPLSARGAAGGRR
jgi:dTDP-4-dehydrorhamnose reductase